MRISSVSYVLCRRCSHLPASPIVHAFDLQTLYRYRYDALRPKGVRRIAPIAFRPGEELRRHREGYMIQHKLSGKLSRATRDRDRKGLEKEKTSEVGSAMLCVSRLRHGLGEDWSPQDCSRRHAWRPHARSLFHLTDEQWQFRSALRARGTGQQRHF